jgi:hypothetical protein
MNSTNETQKSKRKKKEESPNTYIFVFSNEDSVRITLGQKIACYLITKDERKKTTIDLALETVRFRIASGERYACIDAEGNIAQDKEQFLSMVSIQIGARRALVKNPKRDVALAEVVKQFRKDRKEKKEYEKMMEEKSAKELYEEAASTIIKPEANANEEKDEKRTKAKDALHPTTKDLEETNAINLEGEKSIDDFIKRQQEESTN